MAYMMCKALITKINRGTTNVALTQWCLHNLNAALSLNPCSFICIALSLKFMRLHLYRLCPDGVRSVLIKRFPFWSDSKVIWKYLRDDLKIISKYFQSTSSGFTAKDIQW